MTEKTLKKETQKTKKTTAPKTEATPTMEDILSQNFAQDPTLDLTLAWTEIAPTYNKILASVARNVKQDGFRPGKVPTKVAQDLVDHNYLAQETLKEIAPKIFQTELKKHPELKIFIEPELVIKEAEVEKDWLLVAYLPQKPEIKLSDYKKTLTEAKKQALTQIKKDQAEIAENAKKEKRAYTIPTEEQLQAQATDRALFALLEQLKPKISPIMVRRSAQREFEHLVEQLQKNNLKVEEYLKNTGMTLESIGQQLSYSALQNLQLEFILDALLEAEKITATDEEILAKVKEMLPEVKEVEAQKRQLEEPSVREYMTLLTKRKKLADWLLSL